MNINSVFLLLFGITAGSIVGHLTTRLIERKRVEGLRKAFGRQLRDVGRLCGDALQLEPGRIRITEAPPSFNCKALVKQIRASRSKQTAVASGCELLLNKAPIEYPPICIRETSSDIVAVR